MNPIVEALRNSALAHPNVVEGVDCPGTPLECATFKLNRRTFLYVSGKNVRLRLRESLPEATRLAKEQPARYVLGPQGWVKIFLDENAPLERLLRWLDESRRIMESLTISGAPTNGGVV